MTGSTLRYRTILTDNIYGSLTDIQYRGRPLWLPDLAVGRIVETTADIDQYLYTLAAEGLSNRGINSSTDGPGFVSGYDFLTDQASAVAEVQQSYNNDAITPTLLIGENWSAADLRNTWLDAIGEGGQSQNPLQSVNAHFTHDTAIPANYLAAPGEVVSASVIYNYNYYPFTPSDAYMYNRLGYSVGCHSGYSVYDAEVDAGRRIDFPQAYIHQNGSWVGNTGFGYGDSDLVAYTEKLMLNFTEELGRRWTYDGGAGANYIGMPVGQALVRAKRAYLREAAAGTFSVYDEKVLLQSTLYGVPMIRNVVSNSTLFPDSDPQDFECPDCYDPIEPRNKAAVTNASVSRIIRIQFDHTITSTAEGDILDATATIVGDSAGYLVGRTFDAEQANAAGMPTMPSLSIPVTYTDQYGMQRLQDVNMVDATSSEQAFDPLVTRMITDEDYLDSEPSFQFPEQWLPDQPFASSVFESENLEPLGPINRRYLQLLLTPQQFKGTEDGGVLRTYDTMTLRITYLSENSDDGLLNDIYEPVIWDTNRAGHQVTATIIEHDADGPGTVKEAWLMVKVGPTNWDKVTLTLQRDTTDLAIWRAQGTLPASTSLPLQAMLFAEDLSGNIGVETFNGKLTLGADKFVYMPTIRR
jgi:hypothetical protein